MPNQNGGFSQSTDRNWTKFVKVNIDRALTISSLTCVNGEMSLKMVAVPELAITKRTTVLRTRSAVELPPVCAIRLNVQRLAQTVQSNYLNIQE